MRGKIDQKNSEYKHFSRSKHWNIGRIVLFDKNTPKLEFRWREKEKFIN